MKIHDSNTDPEILENVDHLAEAENAMASLDHRGGSDNYFLLIALRAIIRSIEVLQQNR